jgi:hypothetical protein
VRSLRRVEVLALVCSLRVVGSNVPVRGMPRCGVPVAVVGACPGGRSQAASRASACQSLSSSSFGSNWSRAALYFVRVAPMPLDRFALLLAASRSSPRSAIADAVCIVAYTRDRSGPAATTAFLGVSCGHHRRRCSSCCAFLDWTETDFPRNPSISSERRKHLRVAYQPSCAVRPCRASASSRNVIKPLTKPWLQRLEFSRPGDR